MALRVILVIFSLMALFSCATCAQCEYFGSVKCDYKAEHKTFPTKSFVSIISGVNIKCAKGIKNKWFENCHTVGISAGASTPDYLIDQVRLKILSL